jgi:hypothetical protein
MAYDEAEAYVAGKWLAKEEGCSNGEEESKVTLARGEDNPESGDGNPESGNCNPESGNCHPESGNRNPDLGNSNPGKENDQQGEESNSMDVNMVFTNPGRISCAYGRCHEVGAGCGTCRVQEAGKCRCAHEASLHLRAP